jgi:hypothetical protein
VARVCWRACAKRWDLAVEPQQVDDLVAVAVSRPLSSTAQPVGSRTPEQAAITVRLRDAVDRPDEALRPPEVRGSPGVASGSRRTRTASTHRREQRRPALRHHDRVEHDGDSRARASPSATASTMAALANIPILIASTPRSPKHGVELRRARSRPGAPPRSDAQRVLAPSPP